MTDFNSPQGRRSMAAPRRAMFTVSDESNNTSAEEVDNSKVDYDELQSQRKEVLNASKKITSGSKERLEILLNLGRFTKDVPVDGITFSLRSLTSKEVQAITRMGESLANRIDAYFASRNNVLSRCIFAIDDEKLEEVLGTNDQSTILKWLDGMDDIILEYLHDSYLDMVRKNKKRFEIKKEEIQEITEELKKS